MIEQREWKVPKFYIFSVPCPDEHVEEIQSTLDQLPGVRRARLVSRSATVILPEEGAQEIRLKPQIRGICNFRSNGLLVKTLEKVGVVDYSQKNKRVKFYNILTTRPQTFVEEKQ